ncbi:unnamed protein product [Lota lota]
MVPEVVRVSWRRRGGGGGGVEDEEQLELRGPAHAASILVIDHKETLTDQYICRVEHESGPQEVEIPAGNEELQPLHIHLVVYHSPNWLSPGTCSLILTPLAITWDM